MNRPDRNVEYMYFSDVQQPEVERLVEMVNDFIPSWVDDIRVFSVGGQVEYEANITVQPEYRRLRINLPDDFFRKTEHQRTRTVIHELAHAITGNLGNFMLDMGILFPDGEESALYKFYRREVVSRVESTTQDLANIFIRQLEKQ